MEHLSSKTAKQLREYAAENGIDLGDARTKTKILSVLLDIEGGISSAEETKEQTVITGPKKERRTPTSNAMANEDGVITVKSADKKYPPVKKEAEPEKIENDKVAVYAAKNLHWQGVGKLKPGYNILSKEAAEKWLTNRHVRKATPKEVATHYGKS